MTAKKVHTDYKLRQYVERLQIIAANVRDDLMHGNGLEPVEYEEIAEILEDLRTERGTR